MKNRKVWIVLLCLAVVLAMTLGVLATAKSAEEAETPAEAAETPAVAAEEEQPEEPAEEAAAPTEEPAEEAAAPAAEASAAQQSAAPAAEVPAAQQSAAPAAERDTELFDRLMAYDSEDALLEALGGTSKELLATLTEEEIRQIDAHLAEMEPAPAPAVVENTEEATVPSEIVYPTVNYTNVAPIGGPVTGGSAE